MVLLRKSVAVVALGAMTRITRSGDSFGASSIRILAPVDCWRVLMTWPDFPMTPPMRDAWQRSRNAAWPGGTESGGGGCLERLDDPFDGYGVGSGMKALVAAVVVVDA